MNSFSPDQLSDVQSDLEKMQFSAIDRILSRLEDLEDPNEPSVKACMFAEIPVAETFVADIFFVIRESEDGHWYIEAVLAWVVVSTVRNDEGLMDVEKTYISSQEPLPTVGRITQDLLSLVRYEEYVDFFFIENDIDAHLARIGFDNAAKLLQSARHSDGVTYFETFEKLNDDGPYANDSIHFEFVIIIDPELKKAQLTIIKGHLVTTSGSSDVFKELTMTAFYPLNQGFPLKERMIEDVLSQVLIDRNQRKIPVKSLFPYMPTYALGVRIKYFSKKG